MPKILDTALRGTFLCLLYSTFFSFAVTAQTTEEDEEDEEDDSWSLVLALVVVVVGLALLCICLIVVICEIRTSKPDPAPIPKQPEVRRIDIAIQTDPQEEPPIAIVARMPSSTESEEIVESPAPFSKLLDGLYDLSQNTVYGRNATLIRGTGVAPTKREVCLKVYDHSEPCVHEHEFYTSILNQEGPSLMYNQARTFLPTLVDAGQLTMGNQTHPTLVLERGNFTLKDFVVPKKGAPQYVVLSEKSTFFQICSAVRFVHSKGYVHGNLHMGSIMFFGSRWKLIDFSSWGSEETPMICQSTPHYTAPEIMQAIAKGNATMPMSQPADVWSLGLIGWEILTKQPLIPTSEYTEDDIVEMSYGNMPYPWEGKSAQFWKPIKSPAAAKIVQNCIHRDPEQRWNAEKVIQHMKFWS